MHFQNWDTGGGIALKAQPHIFERFYREDTHSQPL
jgi:signal transduction histidine kinase